MSGDIRQQPADRLAQHGSQQDPGQCEGDAEEQAQAADLSGADEPARGHEPHHQAGKGQVERPADRELEVHARQQGQEQAVARGLLREVRAGQGACGGQQVVALMLKGVSREVVQVVQWRVVVTSTSDRSEIQSLQSGFTVDGEIRVIRQVPVELIVERVHHCARGFLGKSPDDPGIVLVRLEKQALARSPARLHVHDSRHVRECFMPRETLGTKQPDFLAVSNDEQQRVKPVSITFQARHFEQGSHARQVVGDARSGTHRIVMRCHQHRRLPGRSGQPGDHVRDETAARPCRAAREHFLLLDLIAQRSELARDQLTRCSVRCRANRPRQLIAGQSLQDYECGGR